MKKNCKFCNNQINEEYKFCPNCGKNLAKKNILLGVVFLLSLPVLYFISNTQIGKAPTKTLDQYKQELALKDAKLPENHDATSPEAFYSLAQSYFEAQNFFNAAKYYQKYLQIKPEDLQARSKYASTLSFLEQYDQALTELNAVLKIEPNNFHANAYTAITYAQMGNNEEAINYGEKALVYAPNEEAKIRFNDFLNKLKSPNLNQINSVHLKIIDRVKSNVIAGKKFVKAKSVDENNLNLYFKDFPMEAMPEVAKAKFFNNLEVPSGIKIKFYDSDTEKLLAEYSN